MAAICVFCASSQTLDQRYLELARDAGEQIARRGHTLVSGGGRVGMMGTVAEGARSANGVTIGVMPQILIDREIADLAADEQVITADLAGRKIVMVDRSDAFLTLPGGIGTMDELFEIWTTGSLQLHAKPVIIVDADGFYTGLLSWLDGLVAANFVARAARDALVVVPTVADALDAIEARVEATSPVA